MDNLNKTTESNKVYGNPTKKLAILNLNWDIIDCKDIFAICASFIEKDSIIDIKIYKTKYYDTIKKNVSNKDDGDQDKQFTKKDCSVLDNSCENRLDQIKKSYFCIVDIANLEDSIKLYKSLDGNELENSGLIFDVRFVDEALKITEDRIYKELDNSEDNYIKKDFGNYAPGDTAEDRKRHAVLSSLFNAKNVSKKILDEYITIDDGDVGVLNNFIENESSDESVPSEQSKKEVSIVKQENVTENAVIPDIPPQERSKVPCDFRFNPLDPRFMEIYTNQDYVIDPSHPEYKNNPHLSEIIAEKRRMYESQTKDI